MRRKAKTIFLGNLFVVIALFTSTWCAEPEKKRFVIGEPVADGLVGCYQVKLDKWQGNQEIINTIVVPEQIYLSKVVNLPWFEVWRTPYFPDNTGGYYQFGKEEPINLFLTTVDHPEVKMKIKKTTGGLTGLAEVETDDDSRLVVAKIFLAKLECPERSDELCQIQVKPDVELTPYLKCLIEGYKKYCTPNLGCSVDCIVNGKNAYDCYHDCYAYRRNLDREPNNALVFSECKDKYLP